MISRLNISLMSVMRLLRQNPRKCLLRRDLMVQMVCSVDSAREVKAYFPFLHALACFFRCSMYLLSSPAGDWSSVAVSNSNESAIRCADFLSLNPRVISPHFYLFSVNARSL